MHTYIHAYTESKSRVGGADNDADEALPQDLNDGYDYRLPDKLRVIISEGAGMFMYVHTCMYIYVYT